MTDSRIFRKVALDRLASPEQLDQLLPLTDLRGWVALGAFLLLLVTVFAWSLRGTIPQSVSGTGILVTRGGVGEVIPAAGGQLTEVLVRVGDSVTKGQLVARMAQPELATRLQEARATLRDLLEHHQQLVSNAAGSLPLQKTELVQQRLAAKKSIAGTVNLLRATEEKIQTQKPLVAAGLLLRQQLLETRQRRDAALERLQDLQSQLAQIDVKERELATHRQEDETASDRKVREARRAVDDLTRELATKTELVSPCAGRVLEIMAEPGMVVGGGEAVLTLDPGGRSSAALEAIVFVPSLYGKQIRVGMPVLLAPSTVKQEEYGMMVARVTSVSDFPTTVKGMQRIVKNDKLVSSLSGNDAPYEVHAALDVDPATASGYRWSSSKGPPQRIESGSLAVANIAVTYRRPIELVIPFVREHTGI
jgi:HlyD family secretion protein